MNVKQILRYVKVIEDKGDIVSDICYEYGEPDYNANGKPILIGRWEKLPDGWEDRLTKRFNLEWSDDWILIGEKCYLCRSDRFGWSPSYAFWNDEPVAISDIKLQLRLYIKSMLVNDYTQILNLEGITNIDLEAEGCCIVQTYESAFDGRRDRPDAVMKEWRDKHPDRDYFFVLDSNQLFRIYFSLWELKPGTQEN